MVLLLTHSVLSTAARVILWKLKSQCVTTLLKTLLWLPISLALRIKAKVLTGGYKAYMIYQTAFLCGFLPPSGLFTCCAVSSGCFFPRICMASPLTSSSVLCFVLSRSVVSDSSAWSPYHPDHTTESQPQLSSLSSSLTTIPPPV